MYSVLSPESFAQLKIVREDLLSLRPSTNIVIVANKCDSQNRVVSLEEGKQYAKSIQCDLFEASSLLVVNIQDPFQQLVRKMVEQDSTRTLISSTIPEEINLSREYQIADGSTFIGKVTCNIYHPQFFHNDMIVSDAFQYFAEKFDLSIEEIYKIFYASDKDKVGI
jgi:GTPase SAR1 family protein